MDASPSLRPLLWLFTAIFAFFGSSIPRCAAQSQVFVIEAEDFNYDGGQHRPAASVMPYRGGAYTGLGGVAGIDYAQGASTDDANEYRAGETPNVPMTFNDDLNRGPWTVTTNYRIGWTEAGDWYNYTRVFPAGNYQAYASISHGDSAPGSLRGSLEQVSNASSPNQVAERLGTFEAPGTGGWGINAAVPLRAPDGSPVLLRLEGTNTLRFTAISGDIDYYTFFRIDAPVVLTQPADATADESGPAEFSIAVTQPELASYQWQSNRVNIVGAVSNVFRIANAPNSANGATFRCIVTNVTGSVISQEARLTVKPEQIPPTLVRIQNIGTNTLELVFSEPIAPAGATNPANYALNNNATVFSAQADAAGTRVLLTTSALQMGVTYQITLLNLRDQSLAANPIAPGTTRTFVTSDLTQGTVGTPPTPGNLALGLGSGSISTSATGVGTTSDVVDFAYQERVGNFDIRVRVESFSPADPFAQAGLMARETLAPNSRFAAVMATPSGVGSTFVARTTVGGQTAASGSFPVNYPQTWLRMKRVGSTFTGFASLDGNNWVQLGSTTVTSSNRVFFGFSAGSKAAGKTASVVFADMSDGTQGLVGDFLPRSEPMGPSSRRTDLVISEIQYHPADRADGKRLEFVELHNAGLVFEDIGGYRISGDIDFVFPKGTLIAAGEYLVVAEAPGDLASLHPDARVLGPFAGRLPDSSGVVRVRNEAGATLLEVAYSANPPWPVPADGSGHSLVLTAPSYGEENPKAWGPSQLKGGSPGRMDTLYPTELSAVVLNEFLAHTDEPQLDFIELHNTSTTPVDISGCWLSDDPATNRFRFPSGTTLGGRGFLSLDQNQLGFALNAAGETLFLVSPDGRRVIDSVRFRGQENGVATGRAPDGSAGWLPLQRPTPGSPNAPAATPPVVINEVMYNPISRLDDDEFVELYNRSGVAVSLSGWSFSDGIDFRFPAGATIAANGFAVVAKNRTRLLSMNPDLSPALVFGDYDGTLSNSGERLALAKPDTILTTNSLGIVVTNTIAILVSEVTYGTGGRWPALADGGGSSLELVDADADLNRAPNWGSSDETAKATWATIEGTGIIDNGNSQYPPNSLQVLAQGPGEFLVDNVEVIGVGGTNLITNPAFTSGTASWTFQGNHSGSSVSESGGFGDNRRCLVVRAPGRGDTGANRISTPVSPTPANNSTVTLRAKVRWLGGHPEMLLRLRGNWLEAFGRMNIPGNLGTPGKRNSRALPNAGPAIVEVSHYPVLPAGNQPVRITAKVNDPDGLSSVVVRYRVDPATTSATLAMNDAGTNGDAVAGDGIFTTSISRAANTLVAFRIEATDAAAPGVTATFPADAPIRECLIRWGETQVSGNLPVYRFWNTQATLNSWGNGGALNNTFRDGTFAYGNHRVIYNFSVHDKGSPFHGGGGDFFMVMPDDDRLLGETDLAIVSVGNQGNDPAAQREQAAFWIGRKLGIAALHRRFIRLFFNGFPYRSVMEDSQEPNGRMVSSWFGEDGDLYKIEDWFEFPDALNSFATVDATLQPFSTAGGALKQARYRWSWRKRAVVDSANDYSNILDLVTAVNTQGNGYTSQVENQVDVEDWMRAFATQHIVGNWDAYGYNRGKNCYAYKAPDGRWRMIPWDIDFVLGSGSDGPTTDIFGANDPTITRMYGHPPFRRIYLRAIQEAIEGPLVAANIGPVLDARFQALTANGVSVESPAATKSYINSRRNYLISRVGTASAMPFVLTSGGGRDFSTNRPMATVAGAGPLAIDRIEVNGTSYIPTWTTITNWSLSFPIAPGANALTLRAIDRRGAELPLAPATINITYTGSIPSPQGIVMFSEIMYDPTAPGASFLELYNASTVASYNLSGWRIDGVGFTFPEGTVIAPNSHLLVGRDKVLFAEAYGARLLLAGEFPGNLDNGGETLRLVRPGATPAEDLVVDELRYDDDPPWPSAAAGLGSSLQLIDPAQDNLRPANWAAAAVLASVRFTPGAPNSVSTALPTFPTLWLNEVAPENRTGFKDRAGEAEPWIELVNTGDQPIDLSGLFLSNQATNLLAWPFPAGTLVPARGFLVVVADGEPVESSPSEPHTPFRLAGTNGVVLLARSQSGVGVALDQIVYANLPANKSAGSLPDGPATQRRLLQTPTPGAPNTAGAEPIRVVFNEWMAGNTVSLVDPTDGDFDDWFELYNAGATAADLSGYTLTDVVTNRTKFTIPNGVQIPPGGHLLVWADEEPNQNGRTNQLHVNFKLSLTGETLALFAPDGTLVDQVTFDSQSDDASQGRFPDGAPAPFTQFPIPTPERENLIPGGNEPPTVGPVANTTVAEEVPLLLRLSATDPEGQPLVFSLDPGAPRGASIDPATGVFSWIPGEDQGPGRYPIRARVRDTAAFPRSAVVDFVVTVDEVNRAPLLDPIPEPSVNELDTVVFRLPAADLDLPVNQLRFSLDAAPAGASIDPQSGEVRWTPPETAGGSVVPFSVRVTDNGSPALVGLRTVQVQVREIDNAPRFEPVSAPLLNEGETLTLQLRAVDPDTPPSPLVYTLDAGAPQGLQLDPTSGLLTWKPLEADGPSTNAIVVRATESTGGRQAGTLSFTLFVNEVNERPVIQTPSRVVAAQNSTVTVQIRAIDPDLPRQTLSYALGTGAPEGMSVNPATGRVDWPVPGDYPGGEFTVELRVRDNGTPALEATALLTIQVQARWPVVINEILYRPTPANAGFIELLNTSSRAAQDLTGLELVGESLRFTFPTNTRIAPGQALVIAQSTTAFAQAHAGAAPPIGTWTGTLGTNADTLRLVRPQANGSSEVLDEVRFSASAPWPDTTAGPNTSLQLINPLADNRRLHAWGTGVGGSSTQWVAAVAVTNTWRFNQAGSEPGATWRDAGFNDAAWQQGGGLFFVETAELPGPKTTPLTLGRVTYYFRTRFNFTGNPALAKARIVPIIDDGAVFHLNGREIARFNMPTGAVTYDTFSTGVVDNAVVTEPIEFAGTFLQPGENILAVEVHQANAGSSDIVMGLSLEIQGGAASRATPGATNSIAAPLQDHPDVWLNEVVLENRSGTADAAGDRDPWVELHNPGPVPVDLTEWAITDDPAVPRKSILQDGTQIPAGGFLVIWADGELAESTVTSPHAGFRLTRTTTRLALTRMSGGRAVFMDLLEWPAIPADSAFGSVPDADPTRRQVLASPTPGSANTHTVSNRPPEISALPDISLYTGERLRLQVIARDPDAPDAPLSYRLDAGAPSGMAIGGNDGVLSWVPGPAQTGDFAVGLVVAGGLPSPLESTARVRVNVVASGTLAVSATRGAAGVIEVTGPALPGRTYRLLSKTNLEDAAWTVVGTMPAAGGKFGFAETIPGIGRRFYRIEVVPLP